LKAKCGGKTDSFASSFDIGFVSDADSMNQPPTNSPTARSDEHMLGHRFYNKHSHEQGKANTYGLSLIVEAINQIDLHQVGS
jgi:hypothetical protein